MSATVYGNKDIPPYHESSLTHPVNHTEKQLLAESILEDWTKAGEDRVAVALRYFNLLVHTVVYGRNAKRHTNNLMPYLAMLLGNLDQLSVFGMIMILEMVLAKRLFTCS